MNSEPPDRRSLPAAAIVGEWRGPDGWRHRRMDWRQEAGREPRGSLLFAGGRGDFIEKYLEALHHWHGRGWHVTAFDWRSQGGSRGDIKGGHLDSLDPLVGDLAALIEQWRPEGRGPHVVVAHSMGGHLLLRALAERKPRIDAAVAVAPMLDINSGPVPRAAAPFVAAAASLLGMRRRPVWRISSTPPPAGSLRQRALTGSAERYEDELWWLEREPGYNLGSPSWGWLNAAYASCRRLGPKALKGIDVPVLLLGTERDRLVDPAAIRRAAGAIPGAELLMFPDAGHEILRDRDEVRLAALARIEAFLDLHAPA